MNKILIIDDDKDIGLLLKKFFSKNGFDVQSATTGKAGIDLIQKDKLDIILCDFKLPDYNGIEILQKIKILQPAAQVIIITGYSDVKIAVEALKKGAYDYVTKPLYPDEILLTVNNALAADATDQDSKSKKRKSKTANNKEFVNGQSQQTQLVRKHVDLIAPTDMSVIIMGETGTGKEYVAREIHKYSKRAAEPFVALDCGALPKELAASELFGHVKGAFTGAVNDKKGCFELASGGTLFLDEVGNLSYENQIKLLRVLQERVVKKVGGSSDIAVDVRVISATNENLKSAVKSGDFREDIYHRLNEFSIELTPLRKRSEDVELFAHHFLQLANDQLDKNVSGFDKQVLAILKGYYWHGNLRELGNVIKRSVLLAQGEKVEIHCLPDEIIRPDVQPDASDMSFSINSDHSLKDIAEMAEKRAILQVLNKTNNNKTKAAEVLDIDRKTLYNKLKSYDIDT